MSHTLNPISSHVADELRAQGGEVYIADSKPGFPCRQCLRDAEVGEELILVSHDPFEAESPYRSASPIFLHRDDCGGPPDPEQGLPDQLTRRLLSVRAFDADAMMRDASVINGTELEVTIERLLSDPATDHLHVHNAQRGCWAVAVTRA